MANDYRTRKRQALERALETLAQQYEAALMQSVTAIDAAARVQAQQQASEIDEQMAARKAELDQLAPAPSDPAREDHPAPAPGDGAVAQTSESLVPGGPSSAKAWVTPTTNDGSPGFDCFLSHNGKDKSAVRDLARKLRAAGVSVWLDEEQLRPGLPWQPGLELGIRASRSVAVLVGSDGLGPWQDEEQQAVLILAVKDERPVIPVLPPDAPSAPTFPLLLGNRTWVDLRHSAEAEDTDGFNRLVWGITGSKAGASQPSDDQSQPEAEDSEGNDVPPSQCADPSLQTLADELQAAYAELERLVCESGDTSEVLIHILVLRRRIREGGRLRAGDFLLDGRYKLIEKLKDGGFGTVYRGYDTRLRRLVAIKVLHGQHGDDRSRVERFYRGARKMAGLVHQGIVQVLEPEQIDEGHHFFVMQYLADGDLREAVLAGRVDLERALDLILAVGDALSFAHERGIIHRDIKPANIVLGSDGRPKLTDFDLVRAGDTTGGTRTGAALGSFGYAAPEAMQQLRDADARADLYGLGMTAVFALHGKDPTPIEVWRDPERFVAALDAPHAVQPVLSRAIAWNIEERFATVRAFCKALTAARHSQTAAQSADAPTDPGLAPPEVTVQPPSLRSPRPAGERARERGQTRAGTEAFAPGESPLQSLADTSRGGEPTAFRDPFKDGTGPGPDMVWLRGGVFRMGQDDSPHDDEKPAHPVRVDAFSIGQYPVTFEQYDRFCAATGRRKPQDQGWGRGQRPVINVSWDDAQDYCDWLSKQTGEHYRLITEAEWEYACRAGTVTRWSYGDVEERLGYYSWYDKNAGGSTHPVGSKQPSRWQLYDMHGNVWEWCRDWYSENIYEQRASDSSSDSSATGADASGSERPLAVNPSGPESGSRRVFRGGSWYGVADFCRSAFRGRYDPSYRYSSLGFRLLRTV